MFDKKKLQIMLTHPRSNNALKRATSVKGTRSADNRQVGFASKSSYLIEREIFQVSVSYITL